MIPRTLEGTRLAVCGKGGSGKSTVTVLLARSLAAAGYPVVVLDADSTNVGLARALGVGDEPRDLLEHFGGMVFGGGPVTCPVDDPTPLPGAELRLAELDPGLVAKGPDGIRLLRAGKLGALGPGAGCDGPVAKIVRDVRFTDPGPRPVVVVDFKAGFEDAARGALVSVDWVLVTVDPTTAAVRMARDLAATVRKVRAGTRPAVRHLERPELAELAIRLFRDARVRGVGAVLTRVSAPDVEAHLRHELDGSGAPVLGVFPENAAIRDQWLHGAPLASPALARAAYELADRLEEVLHDTAPPLLAASP